MVISEMLLSSTSAGWTSMFILSGGKPDLESCRGAEVGLQIFAAFDVWVREVVGKILLLMDGGTTRDDGHDAEVDVEDVIERFFIRLLLSFGSLLCIGASSSSPDRCWTTLVGCWTSSDLVPDRISSTFSSFWSSKERCKEMIVINYKLKVLIFLVQSELESTGWMGMTQNNPPPPKFFL